MEPCFGLFACFPWHSTEEDVLVEEEDDAGILARFKERLQQGIRVTKFSKRAPPVTIVMKCDEGHETLSFDEAGDDPECADVGIANLGIRRATDPDPEVKHFAGSKVLRDNLDPSQAMKAFILEAPEGVTINLKAEEEADADRIIYGFKLLTKEAKTAGQ